MKILKHTLPVILMTLYSTLLMLVITPSVDAASQRFVCNDGVTLLPESPSQGFNPDNYCAEHDGYSGRQVWLCDDDATIVPPTYRGDVQAWCEDNGGFNQTEAACESSGGRWIEQSEVVAGRVIDASYCDCPSNRDLINGRCVLEDSVDTARTDPALDIEETAIEADCEDLNGDGDLQRDECGIIQYIVIAINILSALAGMAIVASIMIAGYQYMTARDNAGQIQKAKQRIIWALIALLVFIFMYAILNYLIPGGVI